MPDYKYAIGERVLLVPSTATGHIRPGVYTVVCTLPLAGQGRQYRVKSASDRYERVVDEGQLDVVRTGQ